MPDHQTQDQVNEIMVGMESVWREETRRFEATAPKCHFSRMSLESGDGNEAWWECRHCGHTKELK